MKKRATKAERQHLDLVASMGCILCGMPAEIHHLPGQGIRSSSWETIPLCPLHHRNGNIGTAVHSGRKSWEANYGTEKELLTLTLKRLADEQMAQG